MSGTENSTICLNKHELHASIRALINIDAINETECLHICDNSSNIVIIIAAVSCSGKNLPQCGWRIAARDWLSLGSLQPSKPPSCLDPTVFLPRSSVSHLRGHAPIPRQFAMEEERTVQGKVKKKNATPHRKSLSCEYCSRSFARLEHLQRHLRTR